MDRDFQLALQLQEQFDREAVDSDGLPEVVYSDQRGQIIGSQASAVAAYGKPQSALVPERPISIVDGSWELIDPNPDIRALFLQFNDRYFWGKLAGVEVRWSPRMTLCAGLCCYEGRGGLCSIRLSEPLLKLRPRKDLVETLLHEMIHALLFVTNNNKDHDGHGPEFCKHMNRINSVTGTKITIYHTFHDEVDEYRQHWWRCNGPCQNRKPFFGYIKRAMNRAPSARDPWWDDHQRSCGGTYMKIKEPENYSKKGKKEGHNQEKRKSPKGSDNIGKNFGADIRTIIPFSGKGFKLGGNISGLSSGTVASSSKISLEPSVATPMKNVTTSLVITNQGNSKNNPSLPNHSNQRTPSSLSQWLQGGKKNVNSLQNHLPKKSVANNKAFRNVNGSPIRMFTTTGNKKELNKSQVQNCPDGSVSQVSLKRSSSDGKETTLSITASQQSSNSASVVRPSKRFRTEVMTPISSFLTKTESERKESSTSKSSGSLTSHLKEVHPTHSQGDSTSASTVRAVVNCPVCQTVVSESQINEHLDTCLA